MTRGPQAYAAELRTAAGLDADAPRRETLRAVLIQSYRHGVDLVASLDTGLGRAMGYPRVRDLARALRPGWWVLRGWIVAQLLCDIGEVHHWYGLIPDAGTSQTGGVVITVAAILASLWLGRRTEHTSAWPRGHRHRRQHGTRHLGADRAHRLPRIQHRRDQPRARARQLSDPDRPHGSHEPTRGEQRAHLAHDVVPGRTERTVDLTVFPALTR